MRVIPKPNVREVLDQITPFVTDDAHEQEFRLAFRERVGLAKTICDEAKAGRLTSETIRQLLTQNNKTINVLISLLGISQEEFFRHVTLARLENRRVQIGEGTFSEWKMDRIVREVAQDREFGAALFSLLLDGVRDQQLVGRVPPFLREKLDGSRLATIGDGGIDALIRTGLKGSYDAKKGAPVVNEVEQILKEERVEYNVGELTIPHISRRFDAVCPFIDLPHVLVEVGVFATTARELNEKGVVEQMLKQEVARHYPECVVIRVLDGVGWIARGGNALANVIAASDYVFTQKTIKGLADVLRAHVPPGYFK